MTENRKFQLDRLYAGASGQTTFAQASRTPAVSPDQLAECRRLANLLPPPVAQRTDAMPGSFGLFRGESVDYILAKAQFMPNGAPHFHYLLASAEPLRALGGNLRTFEAFAREPIPQFATPRADLTPFELENPEPADPETQVDDLLALLGYCKNNMQTVGGLIAALVQMMGIGVINAPSSLHDRLSFIQGLLTLLPAPVRTGITFATSVIDPSQTNAQIKFLASDMRPLRHLVYDWTTGKLLTEAPADTYSGFIMSQMRLDTELVIQQTRLLEKTAAWRQFNKDELATALGWASKRASLDSALKNGLPVDSKLVAAVLRDDPTLPDDMRVLYAKHLVTLALSLDEPERADILVAAIPKFHMISDAVAEQIQPMAHDKARAPAVYRLLARWLTQAPNLDATRWRPLLAGSLFTWANTVIATDDPAAIKKFLEAFLDTPPALQLDGPMMQVIGLARKPAYNDPGIAQVLFLLAFTYVPASGLQRLLSDTGLSVHLPAQLHAVFPHLSANAPRPAPAGILTQAAGANGPDSKPVILSRLSEWALLVQRPDLIDADVLRGLIDVGSKPLGVRFDGLLQQLVENLNRLTVLRTLDISSMQYLIALSLVRERYGAAVLQLEFYQNSLFRSSLPEQLAKLVRQIFEETPLSPAQLAAALKALQDSQLRVILRAQAYLGALNAQRWSPDAAPAIQYLTALLLKEANLIPQLGFDQTLRLIKATVDRKDTASALQLGATLTDNALSVGHQGGEWVEQAYDLITASGPDTAPKALEMLRSYVRHAPDEQARRFVERIGKSRGGALLKPLEATYRLRVILGSQDFADFAEQVTCAVQLFSDMAATYHESQETPAIHKLRRTVEAMTGGLGDTERERLAANLLRMAEQILQLAKLRARLVGRQNTPLQLLQNSIAPGSGVDALRWLGGRFAYNQAIQLNLERSEPPYMLGNRSVNILLRDTDMVVRLFNNLLKAFEDGTAPLDNTAFRSEVDSVWALLPSDAQRPILTKLAENTQLLADLISVMGDKGNERSLASNGFGRQLATGRAQPRSVIDALRWINGYFTKQHIG